MKSNSKKIKHAFLIAGLLYTTSLIALVLPEAYAADSITTGTIKTATQPISNAEVLDPSVAAASFVEHVNFARVALAMKNTTLAKQHISQSRNMVALIKSATTEQRRISRVESGRIVYSYDTDYKYHYFPIETGPLQVKQISNGSFWANNEMAVTDADIVYLTLDLTKDTTEGYLAASEAAIAAGNLKEADNQLAMLTDSVITVDSQISIPRDKARDNIALARNFIAGKNYDGARFALKHADDAMYEMQKSELYITRRPDIITMRKDISAMQSYIAKKDPTMIDQASKKIDIWWADMETWKTTTE